MVPAFTSVSEILSPTAPQPIVEPITPFGSSWKFPAARSAETAEISSTEMSNLVDPTMPAQHRSLSDSAIPPVHTEVHDHASEMMADFLLLDSEGRNISAEPLDFSDWDFSSTSFNPDLSLPPTGYQTHSAGHGPTSSISDSEHPSTDTGASVNTPVENLGLSELSQPFADGGHGGEQSGTSMDFKW